MAQTATLYRFQIELSDIMRGVYETLVFRTAQHPSESCDYLLTRVIAYALNVQEGLEFSPQGLAEPELPALRVMGLHGVISVWIEIGNPSARKLHKAAKISKLVKIYTYKDPRVLMSELSSNDVHRKDEIEVYSISQNSLLELEPELKRDNRWELVFHDGLVTININDKSHQIEIRQHQGTKY